MPKLGREGWGAIKQVSSVSGSDGFWTGVLPFFAWSCYLLIIYEIPPRFLNEFGVLCWRVKHQCEPTLGMGIPRVSGC